jgi:hypothetical protein
MGQNKMERKIRNIWFMLFVSLLVISLGFSTESSSSTYYVSTSGDDTNTDGSADNPWKTIQHAVDQSSAGDTIKVAAGTYNENVVINKDLLTIESTDGASSTIIDASTAGTTLGGVIFDSNGVVFRGFTIKDFSDDTNENKIIRINGNDNLIEKNVILGNLGQEVSDQTEYGILFQSSAFGDLVDSNEVYNIGHMGINVAPDGGTYDNTIGNNYIHDIGIYAIGVDRSPNNLITGNDVSTDCGGVLLW